MSIASSLSIDQLELISKRKNKNNAACETGLRMTFFRLFNRFPASKTNIRVRKIKKFIKAVLVGIKIIKQTAEKNAALLLNF
jgi:hypothetical protein